MVVNDNVGFFFSCAVFDTIVASMMIKWSDLIYFTVWLAYRLKMKENASSSNR